MQTITTAVVKEVHPITEEIYQFIITPEKYRRFETGQFLQLAMETVSASDIWPDSRPFSIASAFDKEQKSIKLIVKRNGSFTSKMFDDFQVGSRCTIKYAFGDMVFPMMDLDKKIVMIAGGTGIAPFLGFVEEMKQKSINNALLFYSARTTREFIDLYKFEEVLGTEKILKFNTGESMEGAYRRRMTIEDITTQVEDLNQCNFYICGSKAFIAYFNEALKKIGAENVFVDEWE